MLNRVKPRPLPQPGEQDDSFRVPPTLAAAIRDIERLSKLVYYDGLRITSAEETLENVQTGTVNWDTIDKPAFFDDAPATSGLYINGDRLGYYDETANGGLGDWMTYMDRFGDFFLNGQGSHYLTWDSGTGTLQIAGTIYIQNPGDISTSALNNDAGWTTDDVANDALQIAAYSKAAVDGEIQTFWQATAPAAGMSLGDYWFDTDDNDTAYVYNGSAWVLAGEGGLADVLRRAATAQATADGKVTTFFGTLADFGGAAPVAEGLGDLWYNPETEEFRRWDGSAWVVVSTVGATWDTTLGGIPIRFGDAPNGPGLYLTATHLGYHDGSTLTGGASDPAGWQSYINDIGQFAFRGDPTNFIVWNGTTLTIQGNILLPDGAAPIDASALVGYLQEGQAYDDVFANPAPESGSGLAITSSYLGFYNADAYTGTNIWRAYLDNTGNFGLRGTGTHALTWNGSVLTVRGTLLLPDGTTTSAYADTKKAEAISAANSFTTDQLINYVPVGGAHDDVFNNPAPTTGSGLAISSSYLGFYDAVAYGPAVGGSSADIWRTYVDNTGNFFLTGTGTHGLSWSGNNLLITGSITIASGSDGYGNLTDKPTTLSDISALEATKLSNIQAGATVGATWGTNLAGIPTRFEDTPSGSGLFLSATHMGYYAAGAWQTYIKNDGDFYFKGDANNFISWNGTALDIRGNLLLTDGTTTSAYADARKAEAISAANTFTTNQLVNYVPTGGAHDDVFNNPPPTSGSGLAITSSYIGFYNAVNYGPAVGGQAADIWRTYADNTGNFFLSGTGDHGLSWNNNTLTITGAINIINTEGNIEDIKSYVNGVAFEAANIDVRAELFNGDPPVGAGLWINQSHVGFYDGGAWTAYFDNTGDFYLDGPGTDSLTWNNGVLTIAGDLVGAAMTLSGTLTTTGSLIFKDVDKPVLAESDFSTRFFAETAADTQRMYWERSGVKTLWISSKKFGTAPTQNFIKGINRLQIGVQGGTFMTFDNDTADIWGDVWLGGRLRLLDIDSAISANRTSATADEGEAGMLRYKASIGLQSHDGAVWQTLVPEARFEVIERKVKGLGVKTNHTTFVTANAGEMYVHGFVGGTAADVDAVIYNANTYLTVPKGAVYTNQPVTRGYLLFDPEQDLSVRTGASAITPYTGANSRVVAVRYYNGAWQYDNNSAWVTFTPLKSDLIIGTYQSLSTDMVDAISLFVIARSYTEFQLTATELPELTTNKIGQLDARLDSKVEAISFNDATYEITYTKPDVGSPILIKQLGALSVKEQIVQSDISGTLTETVLATAVKDKLTKATASFAALDDGTGQPILVKTGLDAKVEAVTFNDATNEIYYTKPGVAQPILVKQLGALAVKAQIIEADISGTLSETVLATAVKGKLTKAVDSFAALGDGAGGLVAVKPALDTKIETITFNDTTNEIHYTKPGVAQPVLVKQLGALATKTSVVKADFATALATELDAKAVDADLAAHAKRALLSDDIPSLTLVKISDAGTLAGKDEVFKTDFATALSSEFDGKANDADLASHAKRALLADDIPSLTLVKISDAGTAAAASTADFRASNVKIAQADLDTALSTKVSEIDGKLTKPQADTYYWATARKVAKLDLQSALETEINEKITQTDADTLYRSKAVSIAKTDFSTTLQSEIDGKANSASLAQIATTGAWADVQSKPAFKALAFEDLLTYDKLAEDAQLIISQKAVKSEVDTQINTILTDVNQISTETHRVESTQVGTDGNGDPIFEVTVTPRVTEAEAAIKTKIESLTYSGTTLSFVKEGQPSVIKTFGALANLGQVSESYIANDSISAAKLKSASVTNVKLSSGIDASKLTAGILPSDRLAAASIGNIKLDSDIDASKITAGSFHVDRVPKLPLTKMDGVGLDTDISVTLAKKVQLVNMSGNTLRVSTDGTNYDNVKTFGSAANEAVTAFATAAQGTKADNALQSASVKPFVLNGASFTDSDLPSIGAGKITSGEFAFDRIPKLPLSKMNGVGSDTDISVTLGKKVQLVNMSGNTLRLSTDGTTYSNIKVFGDLANLSSVTESYLASNSVSAAKLKTGAVTNDKLASTGLNIAKFDTGYLSTSLIYPGSIEVGKLVTSVQDDIANSLKVDGSGVLQRSFDVPASAPLTAGNVTLDENGVTILTDSTDTTSGWLNSALTFEDTVAGETMGFASSYSGGSSLNRIRALERLYIDTQTVGGPVISLNDDTGIGLSATGAGRYIKLNSSVVTLGPSGELVLDTTIPETVVLNLSRGYYNSDGYQDRNRAAFTMVNTKDGVQTTNQSNDTTVTSRGEWRWEAGSGGDEQAFTLVNEHVTTIYDDQWSVIGGPSVLNYNVLQFSSNPSANVILSRGLNINNVLNVQSTLTVDGLTTINDALIAQEIRTSVIEVANGDNNIVLSDGNVSWESDTYGATITFKGDNNTNQSLLYAGGIDVARKVKVTGSLQASGGFKTMNGLSQVVTGATGSFTDNSGGTVVVVNGIITSLPTTQTF